jgi:outer membrane receptor for monomeric catechols
MSAATRLNLSPRETPQSVSVVTRQRMNDQNMTSLDDAMRQVTSVNVVNENAYQTRYQSRGFTMDNLREDGISSSFQSEYRRNGFAGLHRIAGSGHLRSSGSPARRVRSNRAAANRGSINMVLRFPRVRSHATSASASSGRLG